MTKTMAMKNSKKITTLMFRVLSALVQRFASYPLISTLTRPVRLPRVGPIQASKVADWKSVHVAFYFRIAVIAKKLDYLWGWIICILERRRSEQLTCANFALHPVAFDRNWRVVIMSHPSRLVERLEGRTSAEDHKEGSKRIRTHFRKPSTPPLKRCDPCFALGLRSYVCACLAHGGAL